MKKTMLAILIFGLAVTAVAQDWALKRLEQSPRHQEWIAVKNGERTVQTFVVYPEDQVASDLDAVAEQAAKLPASNGKVAVAGFCWGGGQAFRFATHRRDLKAAFVFYGSFDHTKEDLARIGAPVYGFYGGEDARVSATIPATAALMKELGKTYEPVTYDGAGHGFMRGGEDPQGTEADRKARTAAWERWKTLLKGL